ncbi:MAG: ABC transporter ATP-binding protein [Rhizobiales bacterium]|nr:ABC transporter ATP-binding protein [Hyphomicrobiales bacterium]
MSEAILSLRDLDKSFGALRVTRKVTLDVAPGEVHALIGPNGAGKTTLISQIAGSLKPDSGRVIFAGEDVTHLDAPSRAQRGLARVFQISNVVDSFTVLANVVLSALATETTAWWGWGVAMKDPGLRERAFYALDQVGLVERAPDQAADLSYGERRALELAMGLVQNPRLFLLDEPMAGTGREESRRLTELLRTLKGRTPMLLIEHDMSTVFALADRVTVLVDGAVAITGAPDVVRADRIVREAYLGEGEP